MLLTLGDASTRLKVNGKETGSTPTHALLAGRPGAPRPGAPRPGGPRPGNGKGTGGEKPDVTCDHCKKPGHVKEKCWDWQKIQHYLKHGTHYDPRKGSPVGKAEAKVANRAGKANADADEVDVEYHALLS